MKENKKNGNNKEKKCILFVDDEELMVLSSRRYLEGMGYRVVGHTDALEALEDFRAEPQRFDVVITDQSMPQMRGMELAQKLHQIRANIPIILFTGYSDEINEETLSEAGISEYLLKPVLPQKLVRVLEEHLAL